MNKISNNIGSCVIPDPYAATMQPIDTDNLVEYSLLSSSRLTVELPVTDSHYSERHNYFLFGSESNQKKFLELVDSCAKDYSIPVHHIDFKACAEELSEVRLCTFEGINRHWQYQAIVPNIMDAFYLGISPEEKHFLVQILSKLMQYSSDYRENQTIHWLVLKNTPDNISSYTKEIVSQLCFLNRRCHGTIFLMS